MPKLFQPLHNNSSRIAHRMNKTGNLRRRNIIIPDKFKSTPKFPYASFKLVLQQYNICLFYLHLHNFKIRGSQSCQCLAHVSFSDSKTEVEKQARAIWLMINFLKIARHYSRWSNKRYILFQNFIILFMACFNGQKNDAS